MAPRPPSTLFRRLAIVVAGTLLAFSSAPGAEKNILLIAGAPSHGPGFHEHNAGVLLLQKCLSTVSGLKIQVALNGWPKDPSLLEAADAIIIFSDGQTEARHPALAQDNLRALDRVLAKGAGLGLLHYAVEPGASTGRPEFLRWIGGYFEIHRSVNPHWDAAIKALPRHPVTRGVRPFTLRDEWYFNLRFVDDLRGVTPILVAVPPPETMDRPDGPHEGNPGVRAVVARGEPQTLAWAYERSDGGRGFGFTGAHYHRNWGNDDFRKLVLNAVLWLAKMEVPPDGVISTVTATDLEANLDRKPPPKK